jgi:hypothetical protein
MEMWSRKETTYKGVWEYPLDKASAKVWGLGCNAAHNLSPAQTSLLSRGYGTKLARLILSFLRC